MKLYRAAEDIFVEDNGSFYRVAARSWDHLLCGPDLFDLLRETIKSHPVSFDPSSALSPAVSQEVWAAGVTYYRSRNARMEESKSAGAAGFYDRVYAAERPELFFKCAGWRVVDPGGEVRIRSDSKWSVPEPELTLAVNPRAEIVGYTIGNDMSSRDIEGENPLYLPQAKIYDGSCSLGPCVLLAEEPPASSTVIRMEVMRSGETVFHGATELAQLKRDPAHLVEYLFRQQSFPHGVFLMTGTGIVPGDEFTLAEEDTVRIEIDGLGRLENRVTR